MTLKVFIDSDVVLSSLLSSRGAAFLLLHKKDPFFANNTVHFYISNLSVTELERVAVRLHISTSDVDSLIKETFTIIKLPLSSSEIQARYEKYVSDIYDAHIVAGVDSSGADYLITYNMKDFKKEPIQKDFNTILFAPALFLQYLRSK